jgi:hypothetical protein
LGISRTNADSKWNAGPVYQASYLILFFLETNQLFGSNPNVIDMRDTCGQCSSIDAGRKRRALALYFSCDFATRSSCQNLEESQIYVTSDLVTNGLALGYNLGLCTFSGLAKTMRLCNGDF